MGAGGSAQTVQEHLDKQEACIRKIQEVLEKQGTSMEVYEEGEPEDGDSVQSEFEDELDLIKNAARAARRVSVDNTVGDDEAKQPNIGWQPPTEEQKEKLKYSKPWLLAMMPPTTPPEDDPAERDKPPAEHPVLEYVYGYRTRCVRNTLTGISNREVVYSAATIGIVHDFATNTQKFFRGHSDDITCLKHHAGRGIVATGQQGRTGTVCVWEASTQRELARLSDSKTTSVSALAFSSCGTMLAVVGIEGWSVRVSLYAWESGQRLGCCSNPISSRPVFGVGFLPDSKSEFITHGVKNITYWTHNPEGNFDANLEQLPALLGKNAKNQAFLSHNFVDGDCLVVGTAGGELYVFDTERKLSRICYAHSGPVNSLERQGGHLLSGGHDGFVYLWTKDFRKVASVSMNEKGATGWHSIRALSVVDEETLFIGCGTGCIYSYEVQARRKTLLAGFHSGDQTAKGKYGELWAVCEDPTSNRFASVCDDAELRVWDADTHGCVYSGCIGVHSAGGAARCLSWSPDGRWLAAGFMQGSIAVFSVNDTRTGLQVVEDIRIRHRKRRVQALRFSPCSKYLAVGGADNVVDIYETNTFSRVAVCKGNSGVILSVDWSTDSKYVKTSSQDYALLFFDALSANLVEPEEVRDVTWATETAFLGWNVQGVWPKGSDGSDVNAVAKSHHGKLIATADQYGKVKLFRYPCFGSGLDMDGNLSRRPECTEAGGHTTLTNVTWSHKDNRLYTAGGEDMSIFQWTLVESDTT